MQLFPFDSTANNITWNSQYLFVTE